MGKEDFSQVRVCNALHVSADADGAAATAAKRKRIGASHANHRDELFSLAATPEV